MVRLIIIFIFIAGVAQAQDNSLGFIRYLSSKDYHEEVIHLVNKTDLNIVIAEKQDSFFYYRGWSYYNLKRLESSGEDFIRVREESSFYHKSRFFAAYNEIFIGNHPKANLILKTTIVNEDRLRSLLHFELAGISLLDKNYDQFEKEMLGVDTSFYAFREESLMLREYANTLQAHRKKSPWVAGIMSGVIPGSGKIYAGKTAQGISSFITVVGLGFVTLENYRKQGPMKFKTLLFGAAFSAFYISNIYGSVFSVKIAEDEFANEYNNKILFNLHIPLRTVFN